MDMMKLFDSELRLMQLLWANGPCTAKELTLLAEEEIGWNKNTTYTVLKKLVDKKAVRRDEPNFICTPMVTVEQVQQVETENLINKLFNGSRKAFFASFVGKEKLSKEEMEELREILEKSGD